VAAPGPDHAVGGGLRSGAAALGLILTLPILILIASFAGDEFRLKEVIVNFIVLTVGSWAVFIKGLNLVIPLWPTFITG
jgi:hypothetical protein